MTRMRMMGVVTTVLLVAVATGCQKKVTLTTMNHTDESLTVRLTTPEAGTQSIGTVGADGSLTHAFRLNTESLPARCSLGVSGMARPQWAPTASFRVTQDTPGELWFHVTGDGKLAGPYTKHDVHTETREGSDVELDVGQQMIVE